MASKRPAYATRQQQRRFVAAEDNTDRPAKRQRSSSGRARMGSGANHLHNGDANGCNGASTADATHGLGDRGWINRVEYIRLLEQALDNLGFPRLAAQLEAESGVRCQSAEVVRLRAACLQGDWETVVSLVDALHFRHADQRTHAKFIVLEQKFLEALHARAWKEAVCCLRTEITPLNHNAKRVQRLASCILCRPDELAQHISWPGGVHQSRRQLLRSLQAIVPPEEMLPDHRLEALLEQAIEAQLAQCPYYNTHQAAVSLLSDYKCGREQIPTATTQPPTALQVLLDHSDEVWHLAFSHNGCMLATASKDSTAIIWRVEGRKRVVKHLLLQGHADSIMFLAWSHDDRMLATCGMDHLVKIWDTGTGACIRSLNHHSDGVTCVAWLPDGHRLVSGSADKRMVLCDINGGELMTWKRRVVDLAVSADGARIVSIKSDRDIHIIDLTDNSECQIKESDAVLSISLSRDSRFLLTNLKNQCVNVWELPVPGSGDPMPTRPLQTYRGLRKKLGRFVVRSCLGGFRESFVLSGSEESKVYVWHRETGEMLAELEGHAGCVNSVSWNPVRHHMFASASDDRSVHVWSVSDQVALENGLE